MIIIPEINAIYIRIPFNEDGKLTNAIMRKYPEARPLYDQMESDGIPTEYKHYEKFAIIRDPISRLWDFYSSHRNDDASTFSLEIYGDEAKKYDFNNWLMLNSACIPAEVNPARTRENGSLFGYNEIIHHIPENHKSQYFYLMPTQNSTNRSDGLNETNSKDILILPYSHLNSIAQTLGINDDVSPENIYGPAPELESVLVRETILPFFSWDIQLCEDIRIAMTAADKKGNA
jgi:hypothetical protein